MGGAPSSAALCVVSVPEPAYAEAFQHVLPIDAPDLPFPADAAGWYAPTVDDEFLDALSRLLEHKLRRRGMRYHAVMDAIGAVRELAVQYFGLNAPHNVVTMAEAFRIAELTVVPPVAVPVRGVGVRWFHPVHTHLNDATIASTYVRPLLTRLGLDDSKADAAWDAIVAEWVRSATDTSRQQPAQPAELLEAVARQPLVVEMRRLIPEFLAAVLNGTMWTVSSAGHCAWFGEAVQTHMVHEIARATPAPLTLARFRSVVQHVTEAVIRMQPRDTEAYNKLSADQRELVQRERRDWYRARYSALIPAEIARICTAVVDDED